MIIWPDVPLPFETVPPTFNTPEDTVAGCLERAAALQFRSVMVLLCQDADRHGEAATDEQMAALPQLRTNLLSGGVMRYCSKCWTVFMPDGTAWTPAASDLDNCPAH